MLDSFLSSYSKRKAWPVDLDYRPTHAVTSRRFLNGDSDRLVVLFSPWHGSQRTSNVLAWRLAKQGQAVLVYEFHTQILLPEKDVVAESFRHIQDVIAKDLERLLTERSYSNVRFIGLSLGNVPLAMVAGKFNAFDEADIVVGGSDLARSLWSGLRTDGLRRAFENEQVQLEELDKAWYDLAPKHYAKQFANKKVNFIISRDDRVIPTVYQEDMRDLVMKHGGNVTCEYNQVGHYLSVFKFCVSG
jgi:esterase/lipase